MLRSIALATLAFCLAAGGVQATTLSAAEKARIDANVGEWLVQTQAPSVSIAVVKDGEVVYARAYGQAALKRPASAATPVPSASSGPT